MQLTTSSMHGPQPTPSSAVLGGNSLLMKDDNSKNNKHQGSVLNRFK